MNGAELRMRMANRGRGSFRAEGGTIWMYDSIAMDDTDAEWWGGISPRAFIEALAATAGEVTLRINSPGGSVFGAQAMVSAMRAHGTRIIAQVDSLAASAATVIAAEAAETRVVKGAQMMIHKSWGITVGNADDHLAQVAILNRIDGEIAQAYARRAGQDDPAPWLERMAAETWYSAEEAVAAGLADAVLAESTQRPQARWDLSAFRSPPVMADDAPPVAAADVGADAGRAAAQAAADDRARRLRILDARLRAA